MVGSSISKNASWNVGRACNKSRDRFGENGRLQDTMQPFSPGTWYTLSLIWCFLSIGNVLQFSEERSCVYLVK